VFCQHPAEHDTTRCSARASAGLMMVSGKPVAWTSPRGQSIDWFRASG